MAQKRSVQAKVSVARKFVEHVVPGVVRPLHTLWNQVIGFFFIVLGAFGVSGAVRSYHQDNVPQMLMAIAFAVLMGGFGISSFWKARKISRS